MCVDADITFRAVRSALREARHSIYILSWDIDSRMRLIPSGANDGYPEDFAALGLDEALIDHGAAVAVVVSARIQLPGGDLHLDRLVLGVQHASEVLLGVDTALLELVERDQIAGSGALVTERKELHAYVLNWDFAMLYALEREWLPNIKLGWRTHRRMAFQMDGRHPVGASHHQKIIVVDDVLAFVGGLNLTRSRWDTPQHQWHDRRRQNADGTHYAPFHDVQAAVDGAAAHALGELCRQRWQRATGSRGTPPATHAEPIWPDCLQPDLTQRGGHPIICP